MSTQSNKLVRELRTRDTLRAVNLFNLTFGEMRVAICLLKRTEARISSLVRS